ncbi:MAG TPA: hypothetical protein VKR22_06850 [Acidimicrobiales bacterium]|nr:hypothetical protein [Acidimicrobiales bacterium]
MSEPDEGELDREPTEDDEYDDGGVPPWWRRRGTVIAAAVVVLAGLAAGLAFGLSGGSPAQPSGPEGVAVRAVPNLAPADTTMTGAPVDGITCRTSANQSVKYHIHIHVAVFVNGSERRLPAGAGIAQRFAMNLADGLFVLNDANGGCLYFLHVHAHDDILHVESPTKTTYTLGQFFDIWGQPLGPDQVGPAQGTVTAYENGMRFRGNPRDIPLLPQAVVQLDVGTPAVPFQPMDFHVTGICASTNQQGCAAGV